MERFYSYTLVNYKSVTGNKRRFQAIPRQGRSGSIKLIKAELYFYYSYNKFLFIIISENFAGSFCLKRNRLGFRELLASAGNNTLFSDTKLTENIFQQIVGSYFAGDLAQVMQGLFNVHS
jgi:hypothetical protein